MTFNKKAIISVVIINWNAGEQLFDCVNSIKKTCLDLVDKIIIVDNGSSDDSAKRVAEIPGVILIEAHENLGFGKACNIGAFQCESDFILFLNPDAMLYENTLEYAVEFMLDGSNQNVGICGVQLVDQLGHVSRSCARFPTAGMFIVTSLGLSKLLPNIFKSYHMNDWDHGESKDVDHVIGAFFLVRKGLFQQMNGFDERFFVYMEDLDFSLRAKQLGWGSHFLASTQAFHAGGGTSDQVKAKRLFYAMRSRIIYSFKHFNAISATVVLLTIFLAEPFPRIGFSLLKFSWVTVKETLEAYKLLIGWLPEWIIKGETK